MKNAKIRIVSDHNWGNSWYIRDRSCIKDIRGTPSEMLGILAHTRGIWDNTGTVYGYTQQGSALFAVFIFALSELTNIDSKIQKDLEDAISASKLTESDYDRSIIELGKYWLKDYSLQALRANTCSNKDSVRSAYKTFVGKMNSSVPAGAYGPGHHRFAEALTSLGRDLTSACQK